jgi:hypothetical protein
MWNFFGDARGDKPPGTYYRAGSDNVEYFWHTFDQVLIRPDLLDRFESGKLRILTTDGIAGFLRNGIPNKSNASDHLPLLFKIAL